MLYKKLKINGVSYPLAVSQHGKDAPTTSTEGSVGVLYMDENNGDIYKCTGGTVSNYQWELMGTSSGGGLTPELEQKLNEIDNKLDQSDLQTAINQALTEAQQSGLFDGADGKTPQLSIGTVTTLEPGSQATAEITGTVDSLKLNLGIPRGADGGTGAGLGITGATVGQLIEVDEINENGTPVKWKSIPKELADYERVIEISGGGEQTGPSTNLNDEIYEPGRFTSSGSPYVDPNAFRSKNFLSVIGGRRIKMYYDRTDANIAQGLIRIIQYDSTKQMIVAPENHYTYPTNSSDDILIVTLNPETKYIKIDSGSSGTPGMGDYQKVRISIYYYEDFVPRYTPHSSSAVEKETVKGIKVEKVLNKDGKTVSDMILASVPCKSFSILGDSYSTYGGWLPDGYKAWFADTGNSSPNNVSSVEDTWWYKLSQNCHLSLLVNSSWSGTCISRSGYSEDPEYNKRNAFTSRMKDDIGEKRVLQPKPDIIFVFGGINDTVNKSPVGALKYSDWTDEDFLSVLPSVCYMFAYLKQYNPSARIINIIAETVSEEIRTGMKEAAENYGVETIMLSGISVQNGHPDRTGMTQIYQLIKSML